MIDLDNQEIKDKNDETEGDLEEEVLFI